MTIRDIKDLLGAELVCGEEWLDKEVLMACGSDLMSDVLAYVKEQSVLITGLVNPQSIRTAEMMDIVCIIFVRGKIPTEEMVSLARQREIAILRTDEHMFTTCGILYSNGLRGGRGSE